jgi:rhodanese-related sulfurtransferase
MQNKITPNLDEDMAKFLENAIIKKKINIIKNSTITKIDDKSVTLNDNNVLKSDMVIMATGVRPNTEIAREAGIEIGITKAIKVNNKMETNIPDIYACGDCIETFSTITGKPVYRPLGSTANKTGRIAGDNATGGNLEYRGNLSTGIFKLFDMTIASTGLSEKEAIEEGYDIQICHNIKPDKPSYFHGKEMVIKAIADKNTEKILGVQIVGYEGVDKRIDVFATLITYGAKVDELFHLDLAYAPPFSTTKDPVHYTGMILDNVLNNNRPIITSKELKEIVDRGEKVQIVDTRVSKQYDESHVDNAVNMPHKSLRSEIENLDKDAVVVTYCNKGVTGNAAQNIFINHGYKKVYNLSGGHKFYKGSK